ncbi:alpha/beta hydrolase-fold protein [Enterovirga sp.]|uniref:alpha/beta hydrolase n=1 Tax=Enterovirga sp. TaxID=2026350 RepID=UPI002C9BCCC2|nr:alpha/beta hydrolase-fold protein [Enterovirga sp.]HMO27934.1 alpha/beta hydrolase-fold protein [Enterovirga sp.]
MGADRQPVQVPGAWVRDMVSREGLAYRVFLWRPAGAPPAEGFGVTYLLDGNAVFGTAVDIARLAAEGFGPRRPPPRAIVAIGYPGEAPIDMRRRTLDLTPPATGGEPPPRADGRPWPPSGGADRLLDFIEQELKPLVAAELPADPARSSLFGHSFGGLLALHCLFTRPASFAAYVAASPSIWWNGSAILGEERAFAAAGGPARETRLLLSAGGEEQPPAGTGSADPHERLRREARLVDNAREMAARLAGIPRLAVSFALFEGETHGSVIPAALARGLRFAAEAPSDPGRE